jgi:hypothetical protein
MSYTVEISQETADCLNITVMKSSLQGLRMDIANLQYRTDLKDYEMEDLANFKQLEQAFTTVIRYYTPPDMWHLI